MKSFHNKVAVITGAASGIGEAIARECAYRKMKVVLADINSDNLQKVEQELNSLNNNIQIKAIFFNEHIAIFLRITK